MLPPTRTRHDITPPLATLEQPGIEPGTRVHAIDTAGGPAQARNTMARCPTWPKAMSRMLGPHELIGDTLRVIPRFRPSHKYPSGTCKDPKSGITLSSVTRGGRSD